MLFPEAAFDRVLSNALAAWSVAAMIYVDAIVSAEGAVAEDATWVRPTTVLWLSADAYDRSDADFRAEWRNAALSGNRPKEKLALFLESWELPFSPRYADNSRETLRDETWPKWENHGAARIRPGVLTSSSKPRWALTDAFADLFDPALNDDEVEQRIEAFRDAHMDPRARARAVVARRREAQVHQVEILLPDGSHRQLAPGESSEILRGVIEQWASDRLVDPVVLTISEPGAKFVTDDRKARLLRWAKSQNIPEDSCRFLSAFVSRNARPAKRRLKDLASGTYAWYLDEPGHELAWYVL